MEWGCMQALIDFDGWRKWKDFSQTPASLPTTVKQPSPKGNKSPTNAGPAIAANGAVKGEKKQRQNLGLLKTGVPAKMDKRLTGETELGVGSTSGSGSEGSGNGSVAAVGA